MAIERYLKTAIEKDLTKKMVLLGGPRQCGKTTLAKQILAAFPYKKNESGLYLNWDHDEHRRRIQKKLWGDADKIIVFDELHKFHRWKNWLKGIYDVEKEKHQILVTGSARLDIYKRGGDSLFGRYHYWRLHPFTLNEPIRKLTHKQIFKRLLNFGGFPEPFLDANEIEARRWRKERFDTIIRDDIRDLEQIKNISALSLFVDALRERVSSTVVLANIAEDLQISQKTLKRWLEILEKMYLIFIVRPYSKNIPRAVLKPPKVYFFDNADIIGDEGARFENLIACHLLKKIQWLEDSTGDRYQLHYIRDKEQREVDFAVTKNNTLHWLIEAKNSKKDIHPALQYYSEKLQPTRSIQVVANLKESYHFKKLEVISALEYLPFL